MTNRKTIITSVVLLVASIFCLPKASAQSQRFFNLTVDDIEIDSMLPHFAYSIPLGKNYADSTYTIEMRYPEFIEMTEHDIELYNKVSGKPLPELPEIEKNIVVDRKSGSLELSLVPIVERDGKKEFLVSFMISMESHPKTTAKRAATAARTASSTSSTGSRYADNSVLASGTWVKISVPEDGIYQLTDAFLRQCGFSDPSKVRIFGYGGHLKAEELSDEDLRTYDDVPEVPTCTINGRRLFYGLGTVSWSSATTTSRTRNPYANYGCYFLSDIDGTALTVDSATFMSEQYIRANDYHSLHEVDSYSYFAGGRNLFENDPIEAGESRKYTFANTAGATSATIALNVTAGTDATYSVTIDGQPFDEDDDTYSIVVADKEHSHGANSLITTTADSLLAVDTVTVTCVSGGPIRLDYISLAYDTPRAVPNLSTATFPVPSYVYGITNQDHHADSNVDMVIIIPTSQKLLAQAQRIAEFHEQRDSMTVRIVPADELYNEFSSGTPDAGAYRRYLKMMYDRATTDDELPKYLLLFGDCVWDNRMLTTDTRSLDPDDYLLCYESENSFSQIYNFVDDGWFTLLDDGEGGSNYSVMTTDKEDVAVGRFPVSTADDAETMVDKTINYKENSNAGGWQNTIMFMAQDGNENLHMEEADAVAEQTIALHPEYVVKKTYWDAYKRQTTSTGMTYPEVRRIVEKQQSEGALIMNYAGHGNATTLSGTGVANLSDFQSYTNTNMPLWVTAACDISPFDGTDDNIGEAAVLNQNGGAMAFVGTARTVYAQDNTRFNMAFMKNVLSFQDGKPMPLGEALRLTKNQLISSKQDLSQNKLHFALLGDPALSLNLPTQTIVVDSINGISVSSSTEPQLRAGSTCRVKGHVVLNGQTDTSFNGLLSTTVRDTRELVTCLKNDATQSSSAFQYYDRTKTLYSGNDSVQNGEFSIVFAIPRDINYADGSGMMNFYAVNNAKTVIASGYNDDFLVNGSDSTQNDSIGPSIYCYLNTPSFVNGDNVNTTPYFVANVTDKDGINASGTGIGHNMQLVIDGDISKTYDLNDNFTFDFGSYTSGSTYYSIPELEEGHHQLLFRAWDILNNPNSATLDFNVVSDLSPTITSINATNNPASTTTTFIVQHNFAGANVDVIIDVFDMSGQLLWQSSTSGVSTGNTFTVDWDLTTTSGRLPTGVYLYRVRLGSNGSQKVSKAKKLIILNNN